VTQKDIKKFLGLIILMGQTRKDSWKDYWSTDPLICNPIFPQTMSLHRFEQIWTFWHFNDNAKMDSRSERLFKSQPVLDYFLHKFRTIYKPKQQLSLDEGMIPWRGRFKFRTYNPAKITKYSLLVRMVCESDTGYICNMEIYTAEGRKLQETVLSVLGPYLGIWHHIYQDNYYNATSTAELLLQNKTRVCGTIRESRGLPPNLKMKTSRMKKGDIIFSRKGDILLLAWKDKRVVRMISTIHDTSVSTTGKKNRKMGENIVKPTCIKEYNAHVKGIDRADQFLSCCSILRKTMKWTKKVVLYLINCGLFNSFRVYNVLNPQAKMKYKQFLLSVVRDWITDDNNEGSPEPETNLSSPSPGVARRAPRKDPPKRLSGACRVCAAHGKRSESRYLCKFCLVPLHRGKCFTQYHTL
uniref:PiggyBac transposable element-derived protein domain-containing protein n=1 Tax=Myotis lucifugus TaxID=59463 RepID=G1Q6F5_MYOLU